MTFDVFELIFRPTLAASLTSLLVLSLISTYLDDKMAMPFAKSRSSKTEVNYHRMSVLVSSVVLLMTQSSASRNRKPVTSFFTPEWTWSHFVVSPTSKIAHRKLLLTALTNVISSSGILFFDMMFHKLSFFMYSMYFLYEKVYRVAFHSLTCSSIFIRAEDLVNGTFVLERLLVPSSGCCQRPS